MVYHYKPEGCFPYHFILTLHWGQIGFSMFAWYPHSKHVQLTRYLFPVTEFLSSTSSCIQCGFFSSIVSALLHHLNSYTLSEMLFLPLLPSFQAFHMLRSQRNDKYSFSPATSCHTFLLPTSSILPLSFVWRGFFYFWFGVLWYLS